MHNLGHEITNILIAYRLCTLKACHTIFLLEKAELKALSVLDKRSHVNKMFRAIEELFKHYKWLNHDCQ